MVRPPKVRPSLRTDPHLEHFDCCLHPARHFQALQGPLEAEGIHDSGQHSHIVGSGSVQPFPGRGTSEVVAAPHNYGNADAVHVCLSYFFSDGLQDDWVHPEALLPLQRFAADLQHDSVVVEGFGGYRAGG